MISVVSNRQCLSRANDCAQTGYIVSCAVRVVETISELVLEAFRVDAVENGSHSAQRSPENIIPQYNTIQFNHKDHLYSLVDSHTLGAIIGKGANFSIAGPSDVDGPVWVKARSTPAT